MSTTDKRPADIKAGDIVIPPRGRYKGVQCEVKSIWVGAHSVYRMTVVPVIPLVSECGVDYKETVRVFD